MQNMIHEYSPLQLSTLATPLSVIWFAEFSTLEFFQNSTPFST